MNRTTRVILKIAAAAAAGAAISRVGARLHLLPASSHGMTLPRPMKVSLAVWVLFSIYWNIASKDRAPSRSSESTLSRQLHVIAVNVALLVLVLPVPGLTQRFIPEALWPTVAGLAIQVACFLLAVWARRHLGSNWAGEVRIAHGHALVRSGPYAFVRHPIYSALLGMYVGTSLVSGQAHALVGLAIVLVAYWRKINLEECALAGAFPAEHDDYRRETWAWIPGLY